MREASEETTRQYTEDLESRHLLSPVQHQLDTPTNPQQLLSKLQLGSEPSSYDKALWSDRHRPGARRRHTVRGRYEWRRGPGGQWLRTWTLPERSFGYEILPELSARRSALQRQRRVGAGDVIALTYAWLSGPDRHLLAKAWKEAHSVLSDVSEDDVHLAWHTPIRPPSATRSGRLNGFGQESRAISVRHTTVSPYALVHFAWDYLTMIDRIQVMRAGKVFRPYARLRRDACGRSVRHLRQPRPPVEDTPRLDRRRSYDLAIALLSFDFYHPDLVRFLGHEFTGKNRDWSSAFRIIDSVQTIPTDPGAPPLDFERAVRMVTQGAPLAGHFSCRFETVERRNLYNNHRGIDEVLSEVLDKFGKEEAKSFHLMLPRFVWRFIPGLMISFLNWVPPRVLPAREGRLAIDPTSVLPDERRVSVDVTKLPEELPIRGGGTDYSYRQRWARGASQDDGAPNARIPKAGRDGMADENPRVYYNSTLRRFLTHVFNLRLRYPKEDIMLMADDISGAFRWVKYHPLIALAFSSVVGEYLVIPTSLIFGSKNSPSLYMIPAELRAHVATHARFEGLSTDLTADLTMPPPPTAKQIRGFFQPQADALNGPGYWSARQSESLHAPFVDDTGHADIPSQIVSRVTASVLASYVMFQFPRESRQPSPINEKKWAGEVSWQMKFLGFTINTRRLTVEWPQLKRDQLAELLHTRWLRSRPHKSTPLLVHPRDAAQILGLLRNTAQVAFVANLVCIRLQLALNSAVKRKMQTNARWWRLARVRVPEAALMDLRLLAAKLPASKTNDVVWRRNIGLLIAREPTLTITGDASYEGLGGKIVGNGLRVMWRLSSEDLVNCGISVATQEQLRQGFKPAGDSDEQHINVLEFLAIIIGVWLAAVLNGITPDSRFPEHCWLVLGDNTTALSWLVHAARTHRPRVQRLTSFLTFLFMLISGSVQVMRDQLKGDLNTDADLLSRFSKARSWASVFAEGSPELRTCQPYQIPSELLYGFDDFSLRRVDADLAHWMIAAYLTAVKEGTAGLTRSHDKSAKTLALYAAASETWCCVKLGVDPGIRDSNGSWKGSVLGAILDDRRAWTKPKDKIEVLPAPFWVTLQARTSAILQEGKEQFLSRDVACADWLRFGLFGGCRVSEYGQSIARRGQYAPVPSTCPIEEWVGKPLAFIASDFVFFDAKDQTLSHAMGVAKPGRIHCVHVRWRFDKSPRNFTIRKYYASGHQFLCPVLAVVSILYRARRLSVEDYLPLGAFRPKKSSSGFTYIQGGDMKALMDDVVEAAFPCENYYLRQHISRVVPHSLRVTAACALKRAGWSHEEIAFRLRWTVQSVVHYIREVAESVDDEMTAAVVNACGQGR